MESLRFTQQQESRVFERIGQCSPAWQRVWLLGVCLLLYCTWGLRVPLTELDEALYGEVSREMVISHHYLMPHFDFAPFNEKPVLTYWLQVAAIRVFGVNEIALRLPSALCAIALVLLLHAFLLRWLVRRGLSPPERARANGVAFMGGVAAATMPCIAVWARVATMDMVTTLFITGAILGLLHADLLGREADPAAPRRADGWYLLAALSAGLAFLSKGPVGIIVPGLIWGLVHLSQRDLRAEVRRVPWVYAALLFLVVAIPWYLATWVYDGPQFMRTFFLNENFGRFALAAREGHGFHASLLGRLEGLCLYPLIALVICFPCSAFITGELFAPFAGNSLMRRDPLFARVRRFTWVWIVTVIGLFSLSETQLPNYILAITGGAVILFTLHLLARVSPDETGGVAEARRRGGAHWIEVGLLSLLGLVFTLLPVFALGMNKLHDMRLDVQPLPQPTAGIVLWLCVGAGVLFQCGIWGFHPRRGRLVVFALAAWVPVYLLLGATGVLYLRSEYAQVVQVGEYLRGLPADAQVIVYHKHHPHSLVFHARRGVEFYHEPKQKLADLYNAPFIAATFPGELQRQAQAGRTVLLVTDATGLIDARRCAHAEVLRTFGSLLVARIAPARVGVVSSKQ